jgi:Tfp pilus tip-associated adhesin PilY1
MWHATVNGRGKLLNAKTSDELNASIQKMMSDISGKEGTQSGVAVSTASLTKETKKYTPTYTPISWNGSVTAYNLDPTSGNQTGIAWQVETLVSTDPVTGIKTYSSLIPPHASATSTSAMERSRATTRAIPFQFTPMDTAGLTGSMTGTVTAGLINYLRGDATNEDTSAAALEFHRHLPGPRHPPGRHRELHAGVCEGQRRPELHLATSVTGSGTYRDFIARRKKRAEGMLVRWAPTTA